MSQLPCSPEMAELQRSSPAFPVIFLSGLTTAVAGGFAAAGGAVVVGWTMLELGSAVGIVGEMSKCPEISREEAARRGIHLSEAPSGAEARKYLRDERRLTLYSLAFDLGLGGLAYWRADKHRGTILGLMAGGSVLTPLVFIRRFFGPGPEPGKNGTRARSGVRPSLRIGGDPIEPTQDGAGCGLRYFGLELYPATHGIPG